jgi:exosortase
VSDLPSAGAKSGRNRRRTQIENPVKGNPKGVFRLPLESDLRSIPGPSAWPATVWAGLVALLLLVFYAYWPTLAWMVQTWQVEPDYSHGWLVLPLAIWILFLKSDSFPGVQPRVAWEGLSLIALSILMRFAGRFAYADFLDAWSLLPLIGGAVWCLLGVRAFLWSLPAIGFLFFAIPLPFQMETMLSWRLQGVATDLSTFLLRVLGQPAVSEGHVIWIGTEQLQVEEACSGLRIFVGMTAFAYFWAAVNDRSWTDRVVILLSAVPAAILVNALRIVAIGMLYPYFSGAGGRHAIHDFSGYAMILVSFLLLGGLSAYWQALYRPVQKLTAGDLLGHTSPQGGGT